MERSRNTTAYSYGIQQVSLVSQVLWITAFAVMTAIGAQIEIPHQPVPYTLQTMFVLLSGAILGKRNGALSQGLYLLAGLAGIPVFAGFGLGIVKLIGPTGGYLFSFPVAAFVVGYIIDNKAQLLRTVIAMVVGLFIIFSLGTLQLNFVDTHNWSEAMILGFLIFSWWDVVKLAAAVMLYHQYSRMRRLASYKNKLIGK